MIVTRFDEAERQLPLGHADMISLALQKGGGGFASIGLSHYLPGGAAEMGATPIPKYYVVVEGELSVTLGDGSKHRLRRYDSCFIAPNEAREVRNEGNAVASMLVILPA